jgi:hypothetical protein
MRLFRALSALLMLKTARKLHQFANGLTDAAHGLIVTAEQLREKTQRSL